MRLALHRAPRLSFLPWWAALVLALWGGAVLVSVWAERAGREGPPLCAFRRFTGYPCATCGSTRSVLAAGSGDLAAAVAWNPLVFALLLIGAVWLGARVIFGRAISLDLRRRERQAAWALMAALFAINWAWVIYSHP